MLYVSTRNKVDVFTVNRTLNSDFAPDGGLYVPFQLNPLSEDEVLSLRNNSFCENVAKVLNLFFSTHLTGWDLDFAIGRLPVRMTSIGHRTLSAEVWHNPQSRYSALEKILYQKIGGTQAGATEWTKIAIRVAIITGLVGELQRDGINKVDIAVVSGDFAAPMSVWYARKLGLPIEMVICGCNENGAPWDLLHRGEMNTNANCVHTEHPEWDISCPYGLERFVYETLGSSEVARYLSIVDRKGIFQLDEELRSTLSKGMYASVVGTKRMDSVIASVYRTNRCIIEHHCALAYAAVQDYRARTGESRMTVLLSENSPVCSKAEISAIIGLTEGDLVNRLLANKE